MFNIFQNVNTSSLDGVAQLIKNIINISLFLAGSLAVIFIIIGAIQYITSSGNPENLSKAKKTIIYAVSGLALSILSFAIVNTVVSLLT